MNVEGPHRFSWEKGAGSLVQHVVPFWLMHKGAGESALSKSHFWTDANHCNCAYHMWGIVRKGLNTTSSRGKVTELWKAGSS